MAARHCRNHRHPLRHHSRAGRLPTAAYKTTRGGVRVAMTAEQVEGAWVDRAAPSILSGA